MNFDFIANRVFDERFSAFAPQGAQIIPTADGTGQLDLHTGAHVRENGDVEFGLYAPNARQVSVVFGIRADRPLDMEKDGQGVWRATLPYAPDFCGPKAFEFCVDGARMVSPYCAQYYSHGMAINYVEIPDPNAPFVLLRDVPHGTIASELYFSQPLDAWQRCLIYLPPEYHKGGQYPVLYLQHGAGENETSWVYNGRVAYIMDNLIADGKIPPFVIVMNDGMVHAKNETPQNYGTAFARSIVESCIPFVESKYRVCREKWGRAIAGFSMGSMQANVIGLSYPEIFSHIGMLSGFMRRLGRGDDADSPENNPHLRALADRTSFLQEYKLYYRAMGSLDPYFPIFARDDAFCVQEGYDQYPNYVRKVVEGYPHDWAVLRILFHDFAQRLFCSEN